MTELTRTLAAVGISVRDLARSRDFYTRVMGMAQMYTLELDVMDEIILGYQGVRGSGVVLMHWKDGSERTYADSSVKLVFYVSDPVAVAARIGAEGLAVPREPAPVPELGNAVVGFGTDPDGYLIELLQLPAGPRRG